MNTSTFLYSFLSCIFSIVVLESYLSLVEYFRPRRVVLIFYVFAMALFLFGPIFGLNVANSLLSSFGEILQPAWLALWFGSVIVYLVVRREKIDKILKNAVR